MYLSFNALYYKNFITRIIFHNLGYSLDEISPSSNNFFVDKRERNHTLADLTSLSFSRKVHDLFPFSSPLT